jgi:hypothetical protein
MRALNEQKQLLQDLDHLLNKMEAAVKMSKYVDRNVK